MSQNVVRALPWKKLIDSGLWFSITPACRLLLPVIWREMIKSNQDGWRTMPLAELMHATGLSKPTVCTALGELVASGVLLKRKGCGRTPASFMMDYEALHALPGDGYDVQERLAI